MIKKELENLSIGDFMKRKDDERLYAVFNKTPYTIFVASYGDTNGVNIVIHIDVSQISEWRVIENSR